MNQFPHRGLYAIVDDCIHHDYGIPKLLHHIFKDSSISVLQLRFKKAPPTPELLRLIRQLKQHRPCHVIINDRGDYLGQKEINGLHLGQTDQGFAENRLRYPQAVIGLSTHSIKEAQKAQQRGADYIGCGAVFPTTSKDQTQALGLKGLSDIVSATSLPTVAIGGITAENIVSVAQTGCRMAACLSSLIRNGEFCGERLHQTFLSTQNLVKAS